MSASWKTKSGFQIENDIVTSFPVGAGDQIHLISETLSDASDLSLAPGTEGEQAAVSQQLYSGEISIDLHYSEARLLIFALGYSHLSASPVSFASGKYTHYMEPDYNINDRYMSYWDDATPAAKKIRRRATFCFSKGNSIWEFAQAYCRSWSFEMSPAGIVLNLSLIAKRLLIDPSWNNSTTSWTFPTGSKMRMDQAKVYLWPRDAFTISGSGTLLFDEYDGESSITVTIGAGTYLASELAEKIALEMNLNSNLTGANYQGAYDWQTQRFKFSGNLPFKIMASGTIAERLGFSEETEFGVDQIAPDKALFDEIAAVSASNQVNVQSLSLSYDNNLTVKQHRASGFNPNVFSQGEPQVSGTIQFSRYDNNSIFEKFNGREMFGLRIEFTGESLGDSRYEKLTIDLPNVILNGKVPIKNAGVIKPEANFTAAKGTFIDFANQYASDPFYYHFRIGPNIGETVNSLGTYKNVLYAGSASGGIFRLTGNEASVEDLGNGSVIPTAWIEYKGVLYMGDSTGKIYSCDDGETFTHIVTPQASAVKDFVIFEDYIYVIFANAKVYRSNDPGTVWSDTHTGSGTGHRLFVAFGSVFAMYNGDVYSSSDGTTFSLYKDFGNTPSYMTSCIHGGVLWIFSDAKAAYDRTGSDITNIADLSITVKHAVSWGGWVILITDDATIYRLKIFTENVASITGSLGATQYKPLIFRNRLLLTGNTTILYLTLPEKILAYMENLDSANPLIPVN